MTLSWPHLGLHLARLELHLETSRLEISPRNLTLSWPHPELHLEISGLEISPRKLS